MRLPTLITVPRSPPCMAFKSLIIGECADCLMMHRMVRMFSFTQLTSSNHQLLPCMRAICCEYCEDTSARPVAISGACVVPWVISEADLLRRANLCGTASLILCE